MNVILFPFWLAWETLKFVFGLAVLAVVLPPLFLIWLWEAFNIKYPDL